MLTEFHCTFSMSSQILPYYVLVRAGTECAIGEEQCGFRQGRGCMDQVFAVRQVCEKYLANGLWIWKSVWSWRKIVESSAEFLCREYCVCPGGK